MCHSTRRMWWLVGLTVAVSLVWGVGANAGSKYPSKPIDVIIPHPPGGGTDLLARITAAYLSKKWGVPVNAINKPGGQMVPAVLEVYRATPDGYTVLADGFTTSSIMEVGAANLPFKVMDRSFLAVTFSTPMLLMVHASSPLKTLADVVAEAKRDPGNFTWTSLGGVSVQDFHMRQLFKAIGTDIHKTKAVMVRGGSEVSTLTAGNHVKVGSNTPIAMASVFQAGLVRPIAITGKQRLPNYPDLPTFAELGYPSVDIIDWKGYAGPPGLPQEIVDRWNATIEEMLKDREVIEKADKLGGFPYYQSELEMRKLVARQIEVARALWAGQ